MAEDKDKELETLKADLARLNQAVADLGKDIKALMAARVERGEEKIRSGVQEAAEETWQKFAGAREEGKKYIETTEQRISQNPFTSLLAAFGIGFLFAKLMNWGQQR